MDDTISEKLRLAGEEVMGSRLAVNEEQSVNGKMKTSVLHC